MSSYSFCAICKRNTCEGRRHLYTKLHQERLQKKLETQKKEYQKYKIFLKDVTFVHNINKQPDFWCIFCENEVKPFLQPADERQIVCMHIFEHLVTKEHHSRVYKYLKDNNADRNIADQFVLRKNAIENFYKRIHAKQRETETKSTQDRSIYASESPPLENYVRVDGHGKSKVSKSNMNLINTEQDKSTIQTLNDGLMDKMGEDEFVSRNLKKHSYFDVEETREVSEDFIHSPTSWFQSKDDNNVHTNIQKIETGPSLKRFKAYEEAEI
ncbi:8294_t:CDS:2 [Acaulospora morrowiae]|uniref:8294_t:CDS:1 n=1 Tax=Acaulospora morrowiae TaxID=94023 RepID=A0A9N8ZWS7_9GLOM|nr:8294_t:CDS:2 [Acaulospora morrowiae]